MQASFPSAAGRFIRGTPRVGISVEMLTKLGSHFKSRLKRAASRMTENHHLHHHFHLI
jgi:hypothetical protein